jgi:P27 family predicted phage terminase small subunit
MKGRKKKPTVLKKLSGTDQKCRIDPNEMTGESITKIPPPPRWFSKTAKKIWRENTRALVDSKVIQQLDMQMLAAYCNELAKYLDAEQMMEQTGGAVIHEVTKYGTRKMVNPWHRVAMDALDKAQRIGSEFGLTPSSRTKVSSIGDDPVDPFTAFIQRKKDVIKLTPAKTNHG